MDLNDLDLNDLDLSGFGEWPIPVKAVAVLVACLALGGLVYYLDSQEQLLRLDQAREKEVELRFQFETKQSKAANLDAYRQQLAEMQESFGAMLRQLPNKTEVASLLVDVSQTGLANGLEFELFQPREELVKEFYAELPIDIRVTGNYHDFGRFISGLAALPRIVTVHDVKITAAPVKTTADKKNTDTQNQLTLEATVKTYRYLEETGK
jgi:type IV pilus assembly protein PilO